MFKDFKAFIMKGNVLDLAVAVIIGAAFGKIVSSLVNDVIMPPIGLLLGNVDFSSLFINMSSTPYASLKAAQDAGAPTINYGIFLNALINFVIIAFVIFVIVRMATKLQKAKEAAPAAPAAPTTKECPQCCSTIAIKAKRCPNCTSEVK